MNGCAEFYIIRPGDTLNDIAQMFNTDVRALWRANYNISGTYEINEGQNLVIYYGNAQKRTIITNLDCICSWFYT